MASKIVFRSLFSVPGLFTFSCCLPTACGGADARRLGCCRSHVKVGRILYRVATLQNIANDLLRKIMIKTLIKYFQLGSAPPTIFRYKQLKRKTLPLLAQNRSLDNKVCTRDPVYRIPCFESQGKYYYRPYCHIMCRRSTLKAMRGKVIQF